METRLQYRLIHRVYYFQATLTLLFLYLGSVNMATLSIEERCAALSITEEETGGLAVPDLQESARSSDYWTLVGRFLTDRLVKFNHMQQIMASVWRPVMGMHATSLEENLFLFQFPHPKDMQRVIDDGPWSFENQTLVCAQVPPGTRPEDVVLDSVQFWIQIHGLPSMYASSEFIARIGNYVGEFVAEDPFNFGGSWRSYYRMRVKLAVDTPLKRRMKLCRKDGSTQWLTFRYERLNAFCFCCGLLGHIDKFCKKVYEEGIEPECFPYGSWMRAGARRQAKPVGAKWLLPSTGHAPVVNTGAGFTQTPLDMVTLEEAGGIQGDLKRRREDDDVMSSMREDDVLMAENMKSIDSAGLVGQARPAQ
ncbi:PREDICTED: uncharacterized protein LOC109191165 [Ipomoea nil]|uniref:uncharacterized protein LOC109191165 n=1 Tax=Ipomoea nil TaxID=35883 RepID=UPI000901E10C|nr:PREDICTED: uncharacterized protein LOC109191165 [Ipomoea nil]